MRVRVRVGVRVRVAAAEPEPHLVERAERAVEVTNHRVGRLSAAAGCGAGRHQLGIEQLALDLGVVVGVEVGGVEARGGGVLVVDVDVPG